MKYTLKTAYPGGPKVGTTIETRKFVYQGTVIDVTEYPELWEQIEIKEEKPEPKIQYRINVTDIIDKNKTKSVVRTEDNQVISVGSMTSRGIITELTRHESATISGIFAKFESGEISDLYYKVAGKFYVNPKKYILTTHDGVDIYQGDTTWFIGLSNVPSISNAPVPLPNIIHFSTKEAALQYGMDNVKNLSINDVRAATVSGEIKNKNFEAKLREISYKQQKC